MPATITATYAAGTHTVTLTVTGGPSGVLRIYHDRNLNERVVILVAEDTGYTGGPVVVDHLMAMDGEQRYWAYIDDVQQDHVDVTTDLTGVFWLRSPTQPSLDMQVCPVLDGNDSWRTRTRRGWWGDVVGSDRTVGVTDVAMSGRRGRITLLAPDTATHTALDTILRRGVVVFRGARPRDGGYWLVTDYRDRPAASGATPRWLYDIDWHQIWPAGMKTRLPDDPEE